MLSVGASTQPCFNPPHTSPSGGGPVIPPSPVTRICDHLINRSLSLPRDGTVFSRLLLCLAHRGQVSVEREGSSLREAPDPAQCSEQLLGGRTKIRTQIRLTGAEATNPGIRFSVFPLAAPWQLYWSPRAPRALILGCCPHPLPLLPGLLMCTQVPDRISENSPLTHPHRPVRILLTSRGGRERAPLSWS